MGQNVLDIHPASIGKDQSETIVFSCYFVLKYSKNDFSFFSLFLSHSVCIVAYVINDIAVRVEIAAMVT